MTGTSDHLAASMVTVALGAAVQGILGFGCSLVWMSFFPLFTTIPDAVGVLQPLAIGLNALLLYQLWNHANLNDIKPLAMTAPIGVLFGLWAIKSWPTHAINGVLGIFLLLYVTNTCREDFTTQNIKRQQKEKVLNDDNEEEELVEMTSSSPLPTKSTESLLEELVVVVDKPPGEDDDNGIIDDDGYDKTKKGEKSSSQAPAVVAIPAGFVGGCLASAFGTAGPAMLVYAREVGWDGKPEKFRANLQVVFFALNVLAITSQTISGIINTQTLQVSIQLIPSLLFGGLVGTKLATKVRKDIFRILVLAGMAIMGVLFLSKAFRWDPPPPPQPLPEEELANNNLDEEGR